MDELAVCLCRLTELWDNELNESTRAKHPGLQWGMITSKMALSVPLLPVHWLTGVEGRGACVPRYLTLAPSIIANKYTHKLRTYSNSTSHIDSHLDITHTTFLEIECARPGYLKMTATDKSDIYIMTKPDDVVSKTPSCNPTL